MNIERHKINIYFKKKKKGKFLFKLFSLLFNKYYLYYFYFFLNKKRKKVQNPF